MRETDTHVYFWGSYLSNFAWAPFECAFPNNDFEDRQLKFTTSEQCYMAFKAFAFEDLETLDQILEAPDAKSAKALGRAVRGFDAEKWDSISYDCMRYAVAEKFMANEDLGRQLMSTFPKKLVEASPKDTIWGVGLHESDDAILDEANWRGENRLGKVLMEVREMLIKRESVQ